MKTWTTKTGEELEISKMDTSHIKNCIRYLQENPIMIVGGLTHEDYSCDEDEVSTEEYIIAFNNELKRRGLYD